MKPSATWKMKRQVLLKSSWRLNLGVAYFLVWTAVYMTATLPETFKLPFSWVFLGISRGTVSLQLCPFPVLFSSFLKSVLLVPVFSGIVSPAFVLSTSPWFWYMGHASASFVSTLDENFTKYLLNEPHVSRLWGVNSFGLPTLLWPAYLIAQSSFPELCTYLICGMAGLFTQICVSTTLIKNFFFPIL